MIPYDSLILINFPNLCFDNSHKVWHRSQHVVAFNLVLNEILKIGNFSPIEEKIIFTKSTAFTFVCTYVGTNNRLFLPI